MYKGLFAAILNLALQSQGKPSGMQTFRCGKGRIWRCIPYSKMTTSSSQQAVDFWRLRFEQPSSWAWACVPQWLTAKKEENWGVQGFQQNQSMLLGIFVSQLWVNILIWKVNKDQQPCLSSHSLKILKNFLWLTYDRVFYTQLRIEPNRAQFTNWGTIEKVFLVRVHDAIVHIPGNQKSLVWV